MKQAILLAFSLALLTSANSQVSFSLLGGGSNKDAATAGASLQFNAGKLFIGGSMDALLSNKADAGAVFSSRIGYSLKLNERNNIEIGGGYAYLFNSQERKELNSGSPAASVYYIHELGGRKAYLLGGITAMKSIILINIGLRFSFIDTLENGCN